MNTIKQLMKKAVAAAIDKTVFRILLSLSPRAEQTQEGVSVHALVSSQTWRMACATLFSFADFTRRSWRIFVHEDGSLSADVKRWLGKRHPDWTVVERSSAEERIRPALSAYPLLSQWRTRQIMMLKMLDPYFYAPFERYVYIDSDILFFSYPREVVEWANNPDEKGCLYMREHAGGYTYSLPIDRFEAIAGIPICRSLNAGLVCFYRPAMNLHALEDFLKSIRNEPVSEQESWYIDQTLHALLLSQRETGGLLPASYEISYDTKLRLRTGNRICCHYVGPTKMERIHYDGIARVFWRTLLR